ncbi:MAG: putative manganese-dependent inorganic diphosphatase [Spirochaetaceae bacterium]|nr:putative manganese-dependent inorganic diphosphatase [Spirochaetaceae bacterium]
MPATVYVIGHKNPDTDSVVAATAYAALKRAQGYSNVRAARAGAVNPQTEYIFDRFGVPLPEFVPDLVPKVGYYLNEEPAVLDAATPLWEALQRMETSPRQIMAIVDRAGTYRGLFYHSAFAKNMLAKVNPRRKAVITTSIRHLVDTIKAQPLTGDHDDTLFNARIVVASLSAERFREYINAEPAHNKVVLVGDREEVMRCAIEAGVKAIIITNGFVPSKEIVRFATEHNVALLISSYDTSSTSLLALYSTPVLSVADASIPPVSIRETIRKAKTEIAASPARAIPVTDDAGKVVGLLTEGDLIREPNIELILVDHHEFSQAVEGVQNYRILEVIDHHRLGTFSTPYPITFINRVVGSTSTIVTTMYRETKTPLDRDIASLLLCGILSDTLVLQSATTTDTDHEAADYLASITDLSITELGRDIMHSASRAVGMPIDQMLAMDRKEYDVMGKKLSVSQIEITGAQELLARAPEVLEGLARLRRETGAYLAALMATDITRLESMLYVDADKDLYPFIGYPKHQPGVYILRDILSRKKQLMPALTEMIKAAVG